MEKKGTSKAERLRQQLEELKQELIKKERKLKKIESVSLAKQHIRKKLEDGNRLLRENQETVSSVVKNTFGTVASPHTSNTYKENVFEVINPRKEKTISKNRHINNLVPPDENSSFSYTFGIKNPCHITTSFNNTNVQLRNANIQPIFPKLPEKDIKLSIKEEKLNKSVSDEALNRYRCKTNSEKGSIEVIDNKDIKVNKDSKFIEVANGDNDKTDISKNNGCNDNVKSLDNSNCSHFSSKGTLSIEQILHTENIEKDKERLKCSSYARNFSNDHAINPCDKQQEKSSMEMCNTAYVTSNTLNYFASDCSPFTEEQNIDEEVIPSSQMGSSMNDNECDLFVPQTEYMSKLDNDEDIEIQTIKENLLVTEILMECNQSNSKLNSLSLTSEEILKHKETDYRATKKNSEHKLVSMKQNEKLPVGDISIEISGSKTGISSSRADLSVSVSCSNSESSNFVGLVSSAPRLCEYKETSNHKARTEDSEIMVLSVEEKEKFQLRCDNISNHISDSKSKSPSSDSKNNSLSDFKNNSPSSEIDLIVPVACRRSKRLAVARRLSSNDLTDDYSMLSKAFSCLLSSVSCETIDFDLPDSEYALLKLTASKSNNIKVSSHNENNDNVVIPSNTPVCDNAKQYSGLASAVMEVDNFSNSTCLASEAKLCIPETSYVPPCGTSRCFRDYSDVASAMHFNCKQSSPEESLTLTDTLLTSDILQGKNASPEESLMLTNTMSINGILEAKKYNSMLDDPNVQVNDYENGLCEDMEYSLQENVEEISPTNIIVNSIYLCNKKQKNTTVSCNENKCLMETNNPEPILDFTLKCIDKAATQINELSIYSATNVKNNANESKELVFDDSGIKEINDHPVSDPTSGKLTESRLRENSNSPDNETYKNSIIIHEKTIITNINKCSDENQILPVNHSISPSNKILDSAHSMKESIINTIECSIEKETIKENSKNPDASESENLSNIKKSAIPFENLKPELMTVASVSNNKDDCLTSSMYEQMEMITSWDQDCTEFFEMCPVEDTNSRLMFLSCLNVNRRTISNPVVDVHLTISKALPLALIQYSTEVQIWKGKSDDNWICIGSYSEGNHSVILKSCLLQSTDDDDDAIAVLLVVTNKKKSLKFLYLKHDVEEFLVLNHHNWLDRSAAEKVLMCGLEGLVFATGDGESAMSVCVHHFTLSEPEPQLNSDKLSILSNTLHNLCGIEHLPKALMGYGNNILYIWNYKARRLVTKVDLSPKPLLPFYRCLWATAEKGLLFILMTLNAEDWTDIFQLIVVNPVTGLCDSVQSYKPQLHKDYKKYESEIGGTVCGKDVLVFCYHKAFMWNLYTGQIIASLTSGRVTSVAATDDLIAVGLHSGCIHLYRIQSANTS